MANDWTTELNKVLEEYVDRVGEKSDTIMEEAAEDSVNKLKSVSFGKYSKGKYSKSWSVKKMKYSGNTKFVVHNKKYYQLTHLLENGHAKVNGGRVEAIEHIKPVEEYGKQQVIRKLEAEL